MKTVNIGGNEIPVGAVAAVLPVLAVLYVLNDAFLTEDNLMGRYDAAVEQENRIAEKLASAAELKQRSRDIDKVKADIVDVESGIRVLRSKIPVEAQLPVLLFDVEKMARLSRGALESFQPETAEIFKGDPSGEIQELPIKVKAQATFPQILSFLNQVNAYERKLSIANLTVKPLNAGEGKTGRRFENKLTMEFRLNAYILRNRGGGTP
ncbi:MAG: type 4a pilus biogenesis protein PilO [Candidatus Sericytochromatia bacterium]|nr:type 4a pilus biogenesis protein PilO [Candidatus Sericytochromatia bacterium]